MGVTSESVKTINRHIDGRDIKKVCDLGSQNDYRDEIVRTAPEKYPYFSEWWKEKGCDYICIDLCGENNSKKWDLSEPLPTDERFDIVCDFGTSEHVANLYQCFKNVDELCKIDGIMIHENPKTGSWPLHGHHFFTFQFYMELAQKQNYNILELGERAAMGNITDGWNVYCVLQKTREGFMERSEFPKTEKA